MGKKTKKNYISNWWNRFYRIPFTKKNKKIELGKLLCFKKQMKPKRHVKGVKYLFMNINNKIQIKKVFKKIRLYN